MTDSDSHSNWYTGNVMTREGGQDSNQKHYTKIYQ